MIEPGQNRDSGVEKMLLYPLETLVFTLSMAVFGIPPSPHDTRKALLSKAFVVLSGFTGTKSGQNKFGSDE